MLKKNRKPFNSVEAYACACNCGCPCGCFCNCLTTNSTVTTIQISSSTAVHMDSGGAAHVLSNAQSVQPVI
jgi:hypothetical protein